MDQYFIQEEYIGGCRLEIKADLFAELRLAQKTISIFSNVEEVFDLVALSIVGFEETLLRLSSQDAYAFDGVTSLNSRARSARAEINLKLLTLLTTLYSYEHITHEMLTSLERQDGPKLNDLFSGSMREAYNSSFGYRVVSNVSNFAQHKKLPIDGFNVRYATQRQNPIEQSIYPCRIRHTIEPYLNVAELLADPNYMKSHKPELRAIGKQKISLKFVVRSFAHSVFEAHQKFRSGSEAALTAAQAQIQVQKKLLNQKKGEETKHIGIAHVLDDQTVDSSWIDPDHYAYLTDTRRGWSGLNRMDAVYISSEITSNGDIFPVSDDKIWITT